MIELENFFSISFFPCSFLLGVCVKQTVTGTPCSSVGASILVLIVCTQALADAMVVWTSLELWAVVVWSWLLEVAEMEEGKEKNYYKKKMKKCQKIVKLKISSMFNITFVILFTFFPPLLCSVCLGVVYVQLRFPCFVLWVCIV